MSSLHKWTIIQKKNGSLRICLDPPELNKTALSHPNQSRTLSRSGRCKSTFKTHCIDHVLTYITGCSQHRPVLLVCRMGQYNLKHMAFRLCSLSKIFHCIMQQLLGGIPGTVWCSRMTYRYMRGVPQKKNMISD